MATSRMLGIKSDENCWKHGRIYEAKSMFLEQFKKTINVNSSTSNINMTYLAGYSTHNPNDTWI